MCKFEGSAGSLRVVSRIVRSVQCFSCQCDGVGSLTGKQSPQSSLPSESIVL